MIGGTGGAGSGGPDVLSALRSGRISDPRARLEAATKLLEGTFYQELFKTMRATVPEGGWLSGGSGQEMFETLLDQSVADAAAARSEGGVGSALYHYFVRRVPELAAGAEPVHAPEEAG